MTPFLPIIFLRLLSAIPFAILYSSLQLYLISINFPTNIASSLVGSTLALSYGTALVGGFLTNRYINNQFFFIICFICQAVGCFVFSVHEPSKIFLYLSLFLVGSSGITVSLNMLITQQSANLARKEKAFFLTYMSLNIGYLLGYWLAGYYANLNMYSKIPMINILLLAITLIFYLFNWKKIKQTQANLAYHQNTSYYFILIICLLFIALYFLLHFSQIANIVIIASWAMIALWMFFSLQKNISKRHASIFYLLLLSALIFWSLYFLAPMALIVFIKYYVNDKLFRVTIAPQWVQIINSIIIIGGTFLLGLKAAKKNLSMQTIIKQFAIGLLLLGVGFFMLTAGIHFTHTGSEKISFFWIILSYLLQSSGELFIGPIGYALIGRLITEPYQNIMMGIWVTLLGVASAISSILSSSIPNTTTQTIIALSYYKQFFFMISSFAIISAVIIYLINRYVIAPK